LPLLDFDAVNHDSDDDPSAPGLSDDRFDALLRKHAPSYWADQELGPELRLDDAGIGFDSVALVELLVDAEHELGQRLPPDLMLDDDLTVGGLRAKLASAVSPPEE
jgi:acyl carrier protein